MARIGLTAKSPLAPVRSTSVPRQAHGLVEMTAESDGEKPWEGSIKTVGAEPFRSKGRSPLAAATKTGAIEEVGWTPDGLDHPALPEPQSVGWRRKTPRQEEAI
jgi:hypothetical protein